MTPLLWLWSLCLPASAATLEVGPSDDLGGLLASLSPGDEVVLENGVYPVTATLTLSLTGTADEPVVLRARNPGQAVLEASPNEDGAYPGTLLRVDTSSHVTLDGLVVQGDDTWTQIEDPRYYGIIIHESVDVTVKRVEVHQTNRSAVYLSGNNTRVSFDQLHVHDVSSGAGIYAGCSDASCFTTELAITRSLVHDISGEGASAIVLTHGTQGALVSDTVIFGAARFGIYTGSTELGAPNTFARNAIWSVIEAGLFIEGDVAVHNNLIFNVDGDGLRTRDPDRGSWSNLAISYNTIADTTGWAARLQDWQAADGERVLSSNALCNPVGYGVVMELEQVDTALPDTPGHVTQNVVCGLVEGLSDFRGEIIPGGGFNDFTDAPAWDYYPVSGAVVLDVGDASAAGRPQQTDFNGVPRTSSPDVGAYEWDGDGNPGWQVQEGFKTYDLAQGEPPEVLGGCCKDKKNADSGAALVVLPLLGMGAALRRRRRDV